MPEPNSNPYEEFGGQQTSSPASPYTEFQNTSNDPYAEFQTPVKGKTKTVPAESPTQSGSSSPLAVSKDPQLPVDTAYKKNPMPPGFIQSVGGLIQKPLANVEEDPLFALPLIAGKYAQAKLNQSGHTTLSKVAGAYAGIQQAEADAVTGMTTPENLGIMAITGGLGSIGGMAGKVIPRLVSAGFSAQMIYHAYQSIPGVKQALETGDYETASRLLTQSGINVGLGLAAGTHAAMGEGAPQTSIPTEAAPAPVSNVDVQNRVERVKGALNPLAINEAQPAMKQGEGTSAAFIEQEAPKSNVSQEIQNHTAEIARQQAIIDHPDATPEQVANAKLAQQGSIEQRTQLQISQVKNSIDAAQANPEMNVKPSDIYRRAIADNPDSIAPDVYDRIQKNTKLLSSFANPDEINSTEDVRKVLNNGSGILQAISDPRVTQPLTAPLRQQLASEMGMTEDELLNTPIGQAQSAEQIEAARTLLDNSRRDVVNAAQAARVNPKSLDDFMYTLAKHNEINNVFRGQVAREAGRSLQAVGPKSAIEDIADSLSKMPEDAKREAARRMSKLDPTDPTSIEKFSREIKPSSMGDKIYEAWINSLVSGGAFARKFIGDTAMEIANYPTKVAAGIIDYARSGATGTPQERYALEGKFSYKLAGFKEGFETAMKTFKTEISLHGKTGNEFGSPDIAIKGKLGRAIRIPTRLRSAVTGGEHVVNYTAQINSIAYRIAANEGMNPFTPEGAARIKELRANPTKTMRAEAELYAQTQTLQQGFEGPGLYNEFMRGVAGLKNRGKIFQYLFPFVKTPADVVRESARYSPLGLVGTAKGVMFDGLKGGELSDALAKNALGTGAFLWALHSALQGKITGGGPTDPKKRAILEATGWQPYSFKVGNKYYTWKGLPPVYLTLGLAANIAESVKENPNDSSIRKLITEGLKKSSDLGRDIPFLNTMSEITNLWEGRQNVGSTLSNELIPGFVRNTAHIIDPTVRKPGSVAQSFESNIPGLSKNVPPKTGLDGQPIQRPASAVGGFNPYPVTYETNDPILKKQAQIALAPPEKGRIEQAREKLGMGKPTDDEKDLKSQLDAEDAKTLHDQEQAMGSLFTNLSDELAKRVEDRLKENIAKTRPDRLLELRKKNGTYKEPVQPVVPQSSTPATQVDPYVEFGGRANSDDPYAEFKDPQVSEVQSLVSRSAQKYGVPESILQAQAKQESGYRQSAVSPKGARGVMQLEPETARVLGVNPDDINQNIDGGARLMQQLYGQFGSYDKALAAYDWSPDKVKRAITQYGDAWLLHTPAETQQYVRSILSSHAKAATPSSSSGK